MVEEESASRGLTSRACWEGEPDIVVAFPHPQSSFESERKSEVTGRLDIPRIGDEIFVLRTGENAEIVPGKRARLAKATLLAWFFMVVLYCSYYS